MDQRRAQVSSPNRCVVAAHERWAYGEGRLAGFDEGRRHGFEEGYAAGFDAGAEVGAARRLTAMKAIIGGWAPDELGQQCRRVSRADSCGQRPKEIS
jgi:hypothetical protein